jgi:hypothetical protein
MDKMSNGILKKLGEMATKGDFGEDARVAAHEYSSLPNDIARAIKYTNDFYSENEDIEIHNAKNYFVLLLVATYVDVKKKDPALAKTCINTFIEDFPGAKGSVLIPRWRSTMEASYGFKNVSNSEDKTLIWLQASRLFLAYNEFLDGFIGLLIIMLRCALGKTYSVNILGNAYGSKVQELNKLTGGENGLFYLLFRVANPDLRNAIAHGNAWFNSSNGKVNYLVGKHQRHEKTMDLAIFLSMTFLGSHLVRAYLAGLSAIVVLEDGSEFEKGYLPRQLIDAFNKWSFSNIPLQRTSVATYAEWYLAALNAPLAAERGR